MSNRRDFLGHSGGAFGAMALATMLHQDSMAETNPTQTNGVLKTLHHPPKAKRVVQLFMGGAASHIDLWITNRCSKNIMANHRILGSMWKRFRMD